MAEHTPGPWKVSELFADGEIIRVFRTYEVVTPEYDVCADLPWGGPIRNEADARLIAAAPELLAALEAALASLEGQRRVDQSNEDLAAVYQARAAITKAKGI